ncbi:MAG: molybdopterin-dependent oxidoreductase [Chloroflexota bacterium]
MPPGSHRASSGWQAGALAMLLMAALMFIARFVLGVPTLPEIFADTVLFLVPAPVFAALLDTLRSAGKPFLLLVLLVGQVGVGALVGQFIAQGASITRRSPTTGSDPADLRVMIFQSVLKRALWTCAVVWFLTITFLMPALGVGFLGALTAAGTLATGLVYTTSFLTYAVAFSWLYSLLDLPDRALPVSSHQGRREILKRIGWAIAGLSAVGAIAAALDVVGSNGQGIRPTAKLPSPITPVGGFYVVNKDLIGVKVDPDAWSLNVIGGGVTKTYDLPSLKALPSVDLVTTLTCISNETGGNLIGTARWTGVRLRDLLGAVGVDSLAYSAVISAWDNYADSIPIARALDPRTILAYAIDGAPLPDIHGFPLRMIVPGLYGIKNVKWIKQIEVIDHGFVGYWQARGWTDDATVQTQSQIDLPYDRAVFPGGPILVGGIAFAGARGVSKVELSPDGGTTWLPTTLRPPLSPLTWVTWTVLWTPTTAGWHRLTVRATDGLGQPQRSDVTPPIPDGATGYHSIEVRVG